MTMVILTLLGAADCFANCSAQALCTGMQVSALHRNFTSCIIFSIDYWIMRRTHVLVVDITVISTSQNVGLYISVFLYEFTILTCAVCHPPSRLTMGMEPKPDNRQHPVVHAKDAMKVFDKVLKASRSGSKGTHVR